MKIGIIGAGATGLTAGYELTKKGHSVTIFESENDYGGLVSTLTVGEQKLEKFYHHIFTSDVEIVNLIDELGLSGRLKWLPSTSGIYINGKLYPLSTPMDLLLFGELSLFDRFNMGLLVLKSRFINEWKSLETISAKDWIIKKAGKKVYDKVWGSLISSKFDLDADKVSAVWIWNKFKLRGSTRGKNLAKEVLGYMEGSFGLVYEELAKRIISSGGAIKCSTKVTGIVPKDDKTIDLLTDSGSQTFDRVLVTTAPELLKEFGLNLTESYKKDLSKIKYKSNLCMVLELSEKISPYYWTTVADNNLPFVLMIEHTNFMPVDGYKSNIVYLSRYLDESNELYSYPDEKIKEIFVDGLKKMHPNFNESSLKASHLFRSRFAQPVVIQEYSKYKLGYETPIDNLYLAGMAQIYPEDRGQNYSIRMGKEIAGIISG